MAEDRNIHVKLGMAEGLGCVLIAYVTFMVAMWGFEQVTPGSAILAVSSWVGIGFFIVTAVAFFNENYLMTCVFGILAVFTSLFPDFALDTVLGNEAFANGGMAILFIGVILLVLTLVSVFQPIRLLPIFLLVASLMFFFIGLWWGELGNETYQTLTGVFAILTCLIALYFVAAVGALVLKGKQMLPLFIKG